MDEAEHSAALLEHFRRPHNAGSFPADTPGLVSGEAGEPGGSRLVRFQLVLARGEYVSDARFKAFGCPATIASASLATDEVRGRSLDAAADLAAADLARTLSLPRERLDAAELVIAALRDAVARARAGP